MKQNIIILSALFASALVAFAVKMLPFNGWEDTIRRSHQIVVVRCVKAPEYPSTQFRGLVFSDVHVEYVLRGATNSEVSSLHTFQFWPRQGEYYLLLALGTSLQYTATERYRVVPLGPEFSAAPLTNQPLNKQIEILFKWRIAHLEREIKESQEEKQRLEQFICK